MKGEEARLNRWVSFSIYICIRSRHPDQLKYATKTVYIMEGDELICLIDSKNMCMNCC